MNFRARLSALEQQDGPPLCSHPAHRPGDRPLDYRTLIAALAPDGKGTDTPQRCPACRDMVGLPIAGFVMGEHSV